VHNRRRRLAGSAWHRDMKCPGCDAVIVLNTSRITGTIRSVERRLGDLQSQLTERIRKL